MGVALRAVWQIAQMIGLGATVERWFFSDDESPQTSSPVSLLVKMLGVAAVVFLIFKLIGKKIKIG
jgi:hypothetical protein